MPSWGRVCPPPCTQHPAPDTACTPAPSTLRPCPSVTSMAWPAPAPGTWHPAPGTELLTLAITATLTRLINGADHESAGMCPWENILRCFSSFFGGMPFSHCSAFLPKVNGRLHSMPLPKHHTRGMPMPKRHTHGMPSTWQLHPFAKLWTLAHHHHTFT